MYKDKFKKGDEEGKGRGKAKSQARGTTMAGDHLSHRAHAGKGSPDSDGEVGGVRPR